MLIRFSVENFMSFKERQTFSMIAGKHTRHSDHLRNAEGRRILKSSLIFGANASGKSNFIKSIDTAKNIILKGINKYGIERKYFRIDPEYRNKPGIFQFEIYAGGNFYSYGFAFSYIDCEIISEWLYKIENNDEMCIFDREIKDDKTSISSDLIFDKEIATRFRIYEEDISRKKTFLMDIAEKELINSSKFSDFKAVWKWFQELVIIFPHTHINAEGHKELSSEEFYQVLSSLDTGIKSITFNEGPLESILSYMPERLRDKVSSDMADLLKKTDKSISAVIMNDHYSFRKENGEIIASSQLMNHGNPDELFSFEDESDGTKRLFDLLPFVVGIEGSGVILIDEIDRSFHTNLIIRYIELFFQNTKDLDIQLIATLHDVNLMNFDIMRQDEIWFVYRDNQSGSSNMYSLNQFQIRYDKKIIKDYLLGRFGSIPCFTQSEDDIEDSK